jgi:hypothetical protein
MRFAQNNKKSSQALAIEAFIQTEPSSAWTQSSDTMRTVYNRIGAFVPV